MGKRKLIFLNKDDWLDWILHCVQNDGMAEIPRYPRVQPGSASPLAVDSEDDVPASKRCFDKLFLKARNDKVDDLFWMPYR